jgi:hypothetical protein
VAQPTPYTRAYDFDDIRASGPGGIFPANTMDVELDRIKTTTDEIIANLALIQRDDGELANASVGVDQLEDVLIVGVNPPTVWATATAYTTNDYVSYEGSLYRCLVAHTSGTFATDLAAEKWVIALDTSAAVAESLGGGMVVEYLADVDDLAAGRFTGATTVTFRSYSEDAPGLGGATWYVVDDEPDELPETGIAWPAVAKRELPDGRWIRPALPLPGMAPIRPSTMGAVYDGLTDTGATRSAFQAAIELAASYGGTVEHEGGTAYIHGHLFPVAGSHFSLQGRRGVRNIFKGREGYSFILVNTSYALATGQVYPNAEGVLSADICDIEVDGEFPYELTDWRYPTSSPPATYGYINGINIYAADDPDTWCRIERVRMTDIWRSNCWIQGFRRSVQVTNCESDGGSSWNFVQCHNVQFSDSIVQNNIDAAIAVNRGCKGYIISNNIFKDSLVGCLVGGNDLENDGDTDNQMTVTGAAYTIGSEMTLAATGADAQQFAYSDLYGLFALYTDADKADYSLFMVVAVDDAEDNEVTVKYMGPSATVPAALQATATAYWSDGPTRASSDGTITGNLFVRCGGGVTLDDGPGAIVVSSNTFKDIGRIATKEFSALAEVNYNTSTLTVTSGTHQLANGDALIVKSFRGDAPDLIRQTKNQSAGTITLADEGNTNSPADFSYFGPTELRHVVRSSETDGGSGIAIFVVGKLNDPAGNDDFKYWAEDIIITDNLIINPSEIGIRLGTGTGGVRRSVVTNNIIRFADTVGLLVAGDIPIGIFVDTDGLNATMLAEMLQISGNTITGPDAAAGTGIYLTWDGGAGDPEVGNMFPIYDNLVTGWATAFVSVNSGDSDADIATYWNRQNRTSRNRFDGGTHSATIASGSVTHVGTKILIVDTESAAASDNLDTISGGVDGDILIVRTANAGHDVIITDAAGNIQTAGAVTRTLETTTDYIVLAYSGGWREIGWHKTTEAGTQTATGNGTTAGAATLAALKGKVTTEALTTAAAAVYTLTLTNAQVVATDIVTASVANGTNTQGAPRIGRVTPGASSAVIEVVNDHAADAFNGTLVISFLVTEIG